MSRDEAGGLLWRLRRRVLGASPREPGPVNHISLGCHCQTAQVLKTLGLRTWTGPFDWIFTTPAMVRDCLADDMAALVDRTQLESIPADERRGPDIWRGRHRLYREVHGLECIFNHHDPAASETDYRFLTEGVRRLRTALATPGTQNRLWMMTALGTPRDTAQEIRDLLARHPSRNHLTFLQLVPGQPRARVAETADPSPDLRWITVETPSAPVGLRLADPDDDAFLIRLVESEARLFAAP